MTLTKIAVRNFQSLHDVTIELAPFVVVVGATSSGKSAFTRALRTFICNARGTSFISHGEQATVLQGTLDSGATVTLTRGRSSAHDAYVVNPPQGEQQRFTKLGGSTPEEVSDILGIDAKDPLTFATQFDKPYLLADSPAEVARTFGALTNVSVIMAAAREAKRQKADTSKTATLRSTDLAKLRDDLPRVRAVVAQHKRMAVVEEHLSTARAIEAKISRLTDLLDALTTDIEQVEHTPLPTLDGLESKGARIARLRSLVVLLKEAGTERAAALTDIASATTAEASAEQAYTDALVAAHACPLCGQSTEGLAHAHAG